MKKPLTEEQIKEAISLNASKAGKALWKDKTKKQRKEWSKKAHEARYGLKTNKLK